MDHLSEPKMLTEEQIAGVEKEAPLAVAKYQGILSALNTMKAPKEFKDLTEMLSTLAVGINDLVFTIRSMQSKNIRLKLELDQYKLMGRVIMTKTDMTKTDLYLMAVIAQEPISIRKLHDKITAKSQHGFQQNLTSLLTGLVAKGILVCYSSSTRDYRHKVYELTPAGQDVLKAATKGAES